MFKFNEENLTDICKDLRFKYANAGEEILLKQLLYAVREKTNHPSPQTGVPPSPLSMADAYKQAILRKIENHWEQGFNAEIIINKELLNL